MSDVRLTDVIAPSFYEVHKAIKEHKYTHYWNSGGRGSCKSSFWGVEVILLIKQNPNIHALVMRKVAGTLRDSVFSQLMWAIDKLELSSEFHATVSPMEITYIATNQKIYFRGADNPTKIKSIKPQFGYIGIGVYEEVDQFDGMESIRNINQSFMRGGNEFWVFYSYNPPKSMNSWVNAEILENRHDKIVNHTTYLDVPIEWLGQQFFDEAEHLKATKEETYRHEYLGEAVGTGGNVFDNVTVRTIDDKEMSELRSGYILRGLDWGFAKDPLAYVECRLIGARLYILDEIYKVGLSNRNLIEILKTKNIGGNVITCDSANPKDIMELRENGFIAQGCYKFPGSVDTGIKWLQGLDEIVIDSRRTPNAAKEFTGYEYEQTRDGMYISSYPDKDNHLLDGLRYSCGKFIGKRIK